MFKILAIICSIVVISHELVITTPDDDTKSFYKIEKVDMPDELPIIIQQTNNGNTKLLQYKIIAPDGQFEAYENTKNYVIIKSKKEAIINVVPYGLVQRLDKIKYMILWLNLYCEMHRDCDKSVLDEELRKVRFSSPLKVGTHTNTTVSSNTVVLLEVE